jgi:very-short-patch-repair endonuclease
LDPQSSISPVRRQSSSSNSTGASSPESDAARPAEIVRRGYRVIRFWNNEVTENLDGVLEIIARALGDKL